MSNLDFLEISRNFKSYYRTLRDVHFYLTNDPDLSETELQAVSKVLSKLIYGFIRIKGTSFREMEREQFEQEYNLFHQDFLTVIQNSGENNVDFDQFTALIDEIIGIAVKRINALGKIKKVKQELLLEDDEVAEIADDETELSIEEEEDVPENEIVVIADIREAVTEVEPFSALVRTFSTDAETLSTDVEGILYKAGKDKGEKQEPENEVVVADVVKEVAVTPEKVKNNFVDAAPVVNKYNEDDNESGDNFRFRPRRRKK